MLGGEVRGIQRRLAIAVLTLIFACTHRHPIHTHTTHARAATYIEGHGEDERAQGVDFILDFAQDLVEALAHVSVASALVSQLFGFLDQLRDRLFNTPQP